MNLENENPRPAGTDAGAMQSLQQSQDSSLGMGLQALHPDHLADLKRSGLMADTILALRFQDVRPQEIRLSGVISAYRIPYFDLTGNRIPFERWKIFPPIRSNDGHTQKYWQPAGSVSHPYFPPLGLAWSQVTSDSALKVIIAEGEKKAAAACQNGLIAFGIAGVWNWLLRQDDGERSVLPELDQFVWKGREVELVPDSDVWRSPEKMKNALAGFFALGMELTHRGALVKLIRLPEPSGIKVGLDDWLVAEGEQWGTVWHHLERLTLYDARLKNLAGWWQKWQRKQDVASDSGHFYEHDALGISYLKETRDGAVRVYVSNFTAEITEEVRHDDGSGEAIIHYRLTGQRRGKHYPSISVPSAQLNFLRWLDQWGPSARANVGHLAKEHVINAIKEKSELNVAICTVFGHTGWRKVGESSIYLHAGGGIGASESVQVDFPSELNRYTLPVLRDRKDLCEPIKASFRLLDVAPPHVSIPLLAAVALAPLTTIVKPNPGFSLFLHGDSGAFKTTLALLFLSHFGDFATAESLSNFSDTANSLERRAFILKDMPMLVDDFHPSASPSEAMEKERTLQRLVRAVGNRTGRARLNSDSSEKGRYAPRAMLWITGEDLPGVQSTLARLLIIDLDRGMVDRERLTEAQRTASRLPEAMSGYISWLMPQLEILISSAGKKISEIREEMTTERLHPRVGEAIAILQFAWQLYLAYAREHCALDQKRWDDLTMQGRAQMCAIGRGQADRIKGEDPAALFIGILNALLHSEKVMFRRPLPDDQVRSTPIGQLDGEAVNLLPTEAWHAVREFCRSEGRVFPVTPRALHKMLYTRGWLIPDPETNHLEARRTVFGRRCRVLRMPAKLFQEGGEEPE